MKFDEQYQQRWPVESIAEGGGIPEIENQVPARDVWDALIKCAHNSAEPGILFWDTATKMTPSDIYKDEGFGSTSTNPCGDCLLYTSPSPRDLSTSRMPSSA